MQKNLLPGALLIAAACMPLSALAAPTACTGTLIGGSFDAIVVPAGAGCFMDGATVLGNVLVQPGGSAFVFNTSIGGNLVGDAPSAVHCGSCTIAGNITVDGAGPGGQPINMGANTVGGNVILTGSQSFLNFGANTVRGNVIVSDNFNITSTQYGAGFFVHNNLVDGQIIVANNTGTSGEMVFNNAAGKQVHCSGNQNFSAFGNVATKLKGQC